MAPPGRRGSVAPLRSIAVGSIIRRDGAPAATLHGRGIKKATSSGVLNKSSNTFLTESSFEVNAIKPVDISVSVESTVSADSFGLPTEGHSSSGDTSKSPNLEENHRQSTFRRPRQFRNFRDELEYMNLDRDAQQDKREEALVEANHEEDDDEDGAIDHPDSPKAMSSPPCSPINHADERPVMSVEVSAAGFLRDVEQVPFVDDNDENEAILRTKKSKPIHHEQSKQERRYWSALLTSRIETYGHGHLKTVEALMHLGNAQLLCREYQDALATFKAAHRILRKVLNNSDRNVAIAKALDRIGLAGCKAYPKSFDDLHSARTALHQAFLLRFELLGPWHVDTVDSLNNLARVQMLLAHYREARKSYYEVLRVRRAIFGPDHPSVAVTAHSLAKACVRLDQLEESYTYFQMAMDIYVQMDMPIENPTFASLLQDVKRLERVLPGIVSRCTL